MLKMFKTHDKIKGLHFDTYEEWKRSELPFDQICGPSPGGASAQLGVSRAVIYTWVDLGLLERVLIGSGGHAVVFISTRSLYWVENIIKQLREEWQTETLHGRRVSSELQKRLPQRDFFQAEH
jgi:hypothetical protein